MSQAGKGKGRYKIDRGAEQAVFQALQEQLVAHKSRKGAPLLEGRAHTVELMHVANKWLADHNKPQVKSKETVRSWAKLRSKRSIQAKQHCGQGLFAFKKMQKKYVESHINVHHNRAHIKMYHRTFYSSTQRQLLAKCTCCRCFDDKAYLRCGTSEGFSRPRTKSIVMPGSKILLPSYDFPEKAGYVAPGANLMINNMEEQTTDGRDIFVTKDVTISVTCKPKLVYSSSAAHWANDAYQDRLLFPEEYEVEGTGADVPRNTKTTLVFL